MAKVSIVIPAYNSEQWVSDAIGSALAQTYADREVVVVNDGSTDGTEKEIVRLADKIIYVKQENKGLSAARNAGIKAASGEFIIPLDSDDKITPDFIEKLMPFMEKYDFASTWVRAFGDINIVWHFGPYDDIKHLQGKIGLCYCALYKKSMWEKIGGYKEIRTKNGVQGFEDYEFWISAWESGFSGYVLPEPLFLYRKHGPSMISTAEENSKELRAIIRSLHEETFKKYEKE